MPSGLVVPITTADRAKRLAAPPPDEPWALIAAAQMHSEGRLVAPASKDEVPDERPR
jgi:hypothetical protein